jgi:hypothetical protein
MIDITTPFPLPWSVGHYGFDIKASNGTHVAEICSASDEDGDKELAALICRAVNNHDALVRALEHVTELLVDTWSTAMEGDPEKEIAVADARALLDAASKTEVQS